MQSQDCLIEMCNRQQTSLELTDIQTVHWLCGSDEGFQDPPRSQISTVCPVVLPCCAAVSCRSSCLVLLQSAYLTPPRRRRWCVTKIADALMRCTPMREHGFARVQCLLKNHGGLFGHGILNPSVLYIIHLQTPLSYNSQQYPAKRWIPLSYYHFYLQRGLSLVEQKPLHMPVKLTRRLSKYD